MKNQDIEFLKIIKENQVIIYKTCKVYTNNDIDFELLFQEVILQIRNLYEASKIKFNLSNWIYRVTLNTAITIFEKEKIVSQSFRILQNKVLKKEKLEQQESIEFIYTFIKSFTKIERAIFLLFLEDLSNKAIAGILGVTESGVESKLKKIQDKFKTIENNHFHKANLKELKKYWREQNIIFNRIYSDEKLLGVTHKKSKNRINNIYNISKVELIIVLFFLIFVSFYVNIYEKINGLPIKYFQSIQMSKLLNLINIILFFLSIVISYTSYKKLQSIETIKQLIKDIYKYRKIVYYSIFINVIINMVVLYLSGFYNYIPISYHEFYLYNGLENLELYFFHNLLNFILICLLIIFIMILYYIFSYGIYLNKLKVNLLELQDISKS